MTYAGRLGVCAAISVAGHLALARGSSRLPAQAPENKPIVLAVQLRAPEPPPPEPEPEAPKPAEPEPKRVHERATRPTQKIDPNLPRRDNPPKDPVPTERPNPNADSANVPVFGISMESTSAAGTGPAMAVGNTLQARRTGPVGDVGAPKPLMAPAAAYEVTKMPLPKQECSGQYTAEARAARLEGVVVFDLVVDEHGKPRDLTLVSGLGQGLTEAARRAVMACLFSPGERDGKPVPVRVRGFKIRFQLRDDE